MLLASVVVIAPITWGILYFLFSHRLETLTQDNSLLEKDAERLRRQVDELRAACSPAPPATTARADSSPGGIVAVHPSFALNRVINEAIAAARHNVAIAGYWLPQWIENAAIRAALDTGATVTILIAQKDSASLRLRSLDLGADTSYGAKRRDDGMVRLGLLSTQLTAAQRTRLQVFEHSERLSLLIVRADEHHFLGAYLHGRSISDMHMIEADGASSLVATSIAQELETLLASSQRTALEMSG